MSLEPKLEKKLSKRGLHERVYECTWNGKPAAVALGVDQMSVVGGGFGDDIGAPFSATRTTVVDGLSRRIRCYGMEATVTFRMPSDVKAFDAELASRATAVGAFTTREHHDPIPAEFVTTLQSLPGYRIVQVRGAITELTATSGFTATSKGTTSLENGMTQLRRSATRMRANAIVGLTCSAFGAAGGITSAFGGDAVGVLFAGTAVVVQPVVDPGLET